MGTSTERDVEKSYPKAEFVAKLRRLADAIESGHRFEIQIAGERIYIPVRATFMIEHEKSGAMRKLSFRLSGVASNLFLNQKRSTIRFTPPLLHPSAHSASDAATANNVESAFRLNG